VSGTREFGYRDSDAGLVILIRGADRSTNGIAESVAYLAADRLWRSVQRKLVDFVTDGGGSATALEPFSERFHPAVVDILYGP
jgi:hypothetical protein